MSQLTLRRAAAFFVNDIALDITGLSGTGISTSAIRWDWDSIAGVDGYEYAVRVAGGAWGETQTQTPSEVTRSGLLAGFSYEIRVRAIVGGRTGDYAYSVSSTVLPPPGAPSGLHINSRTNASITYDWFGGSYATSYDTSYRRVGTTGWSAIVNTTATLRTVAGLIADTTYEFRVRSRNATVNQVRRSAYVMLTATTSSPWRDTTPNTKSLGSGILAGLSVASNRYIYVLNDSTDRISRYTSWSDTSPDTKSLRSGAWRGLSVAANGYIYVLNDSTNRISRYTSWSDTSPDTKSLGSGFWSGLSVAANGYIYALDSTTDRISRYTSWSDTSPDTKSLGSGILTGLSVAANGYIYVLNSTTNRISRYTSWSDTSPDTKSLGSGSWAGLSVAANGYIYVLNSTTNRISRYT